MVARILSLNHVVISQRVELGPATILALQGRDVTIIRIDLYLSRPRRLVLKPRLTLGRDCLPENFSFAHRDFITFVRLVLSRLMPQERFLRWDQLDLGVVPWRVTWRRLGGRQHVVGA